MNLQEYFDKKDPILIGEWFLVSSHSEIRPWQKKRLVYDSSCFLCVINTRVNGEINSQ